MKVKLIGVHPKENGDAFITSTARFCKTGEFKEVEANERIIKQMLEQEHNTPFEFGVIQFEIQAPIYVIRQIIRHRIATYLEFSQRYVKDKTKLFHFDYPNEFIKKSMPFDLQEKVENHIKNGQDLYMELLDNGFSREASRAILPTGTRSYILMSTNLWSLYNFFKKRLNKHAQIDTRLVAYELFKLTEEHFPITTKVIKDNIDISV